RCSDDDRHAGSEAGAHVLLHRIWAGEVDSGVGAFSRVDQLVTRLLERRPENGADLAVPAQQKDFHAALRPTRAGFTRCTAALNRASLGPIPAADSRSSRSRSPAI